MIRTDQILKNRNHIQITAHRHMIDDDSSIDFNDKYYRQNDIIQERKLPSSSVLPIVSLSCCTTRRNVIQQLFLLGIPIISSSNICHAEEDEEKLSKSNRYENYNSNNSNNTIRDITTGSTINDNTTTIIPTAPYATSVQALIPAIRVRYMIDQSIQIAQQIVTLQQQPSSSSSSSSSSFESNQSEIITLVLQLQQLLLQPQNYTSIIIRNSSSNNSMTSSILTGIDSDTKSYSSDRIAKSYWDRYNENRALWDIWAQPGALLVQGGEIATWKRLQQQEQILERNDEIRAALNVYMNQIQYSTTQYTLRVPNEIRKQMIRTETLPDIIRQVVPSDMDLRTLYRNSILTSIQDVRAELQYQLLLLQQQPPPTTVTSNVDGIELLHLLQIAHDAILQWFQMIDPQEIHRAELEEEQTRIVLEYE